MLTKDELMSGFDVSPEFSEAMQLMDVEKEDMLNLFNCLDEDGSGDIAYDEFVENLHKMKCQDTHMMLVFLRSTVKDIRTKLLDDLAFLKDELVAKTENLEIDTKSLLALARAAKEPAVTGATTRSAAAGGGGVIEVANSADVAAGLMSLTLIEPSKSSPAGSGWSTPLPLGQELARLRQQVQEHLVRAAREIDAAVAGPRGPPPIRSPVGGALPAVPEAIGAPAPRQHPSFLDGCQAPSRSPPDNAAPASSFAVA